MQIHRRAALLEANRALDAGCDDYDSKPVELERLLAKMNALLADV